MTKITEKDDVILLEIDDKNIEFPSIIVDMEVLITSDFPKEDIQNQVLDRINDTLDSEGIKLDDDTFGDLVELLTEININYFNENKNL